MIKIVEAEAVRDRIVYLRFSDGSEGEYDLAPLVERDGAMVVPLRDADYFRRVFLEAGALCWPNGFDLSPSAIYQEMMTLGRLRQANPA